MVRVDVIVIGGGLAGCSMVWQCRLRGLRPVLIDSARPDSSSRVAAGLVTPVTGSRFATSWRWNEFFPVANDFYRAIEHETEQCFWKVAPAWRAFESEHEAERCFNRWPDALLQVNAQDLSLDCSSPLSLRAIPANQLPIVKSPWGGLHMEPAARLDTRTYIDATRQVQERDGLLISDEVNVDQELLVQQGDCQIPKMNLQSRWLVLCQGFWSRSNRWFRSLPLHPARGDILEVASRSVRLDHVVHQGGWIVPIEPNRFLVGATYDRHVLDTSADHPAAARWRQELCNQWSRITGESLGPTGASVLEHRIGVRPASYDRHPLIGPHFKHPNLLCINGLGSKGSLMAPYLSARMMAWILDKTPIESALHWNRRIAG